VRNLRHVIELANELMSIDNIDPVPRYLILRDVIQRSVDSNEMREAKDDIYRNPWVTELIELQLPDGGWGRFHSGSKEHPHCTRKMVKHGFRLGLRGNDPVFQKCLTYLKGLYTGDVAWPDGETWEKNDRWPIEMKYSYANLIARIDPLNSVIDSEWELWVEIARRASREGFWDLAKEQSALVDIFGTRAFKDRPPLHMYGLSLIGSRASRLEPQLESVLIQRAWERGVGGYFLNGDFEAGPMRWLSWWFESQFDLMPFPSWANLFEPIAEKLWECRDAEGLWDFGSKANSRYEGLVLSEHWRRKLHRKIDHSTNVLILLAGLYR